MQRWEYKIAYRSESSGEWFIDGRKAGDLGKAEEPEVLNRLGQEGWELVSVVGYTYFFKRLVKER
ncbi:MAG TPA: DUF4177 domain-containing protein [Armatimonadota bacterium]|nr:DUF4177 domain-containing protein [Armatimonadota bacterium]